MRPERVVIHTKLTPPRPNKRTLDRPRLTRQLHQVTDYRLTILQAGAGYGKSTALMQLAQVEAPTVWYQIEAEDADPYVFLSYLLHGFNTVFDGVADQALALLNDSRPAWNLVLDTFINTLAQTIEGPTLLILDDAHLLNQSDASLILLERLLKHAPRHLHIVLAVRQLPRIDDLVVWRVRGEILSITQEDLAFTPDEIQRFFERRQALSADDAENLHEQTEGWAIALQLIEQGLPTDNLDDAFDQLAGSKNDLFAYLAQEVLNQLPPDLQDFLRQSTVLRTLTPALCACLLPDHEGALDQLRDASVFLLPLEGAAVRYHTLLREFLYATLPAEEARQLHRKAAACHPAAPDEAIYHLLRADAYTEAAHLIVERGQEMVAAGRLETLSTWVGQLPDDVREQFPMLQIYVGDVARLHSHFDDALAAYRQAADQFEARQQPQGVAYALRGQARVYLDTVIPSKAQHFLEEALHAIEGVPDTHDLKASLLELMAENLINRGQSEKAARLQDEALALRQSETSEVAVRALLRTGQLAQTRRLLEKQAAEERHHPVLRPRAHRETLLLLSLVLAFQGEADAAYQTAVEGTERGHLLEAPLVTAVGAMRQGHALLIHDRTDAARDMFEQAITYSDELGVVRLKAEALWGLCRAYGYQGDIERAAEVAEQGLHIAQEAGDDWITAHIQLTLASAYTMQAHNDEAIMWVNRAYTTFEACGDPFGQAAALLWQCLSDEASLHDLLALVEKHDYPMLLTRRTLLGLPEPRRGVPLLLKARREGISYADDLLRRMNLGQVETHPGYQLKVHMLGAFNIWRGDEKIGPGDWPREKARQMFHIFITERGKLIDRERLYGLLWPDLDTDAAGRSFRVTLNALYGVLEPNREAGAPSAYIVRESSLYGLRPSADMLIDAVQFEDAIEAGNKAYPRDKVASFDHYRHALRMYQGDYCAEYLYEEWLQDERIRLRALFLRTAERAGGILLEMHDWEEVIGIGSQIIAVDNCWESAYRLMMQAYVGLGNRAQALRTFHRLEQTLEAELDTIPSEETAALYQRLSHDV